MSNKQLGFNHKVLIYKEINMENKRICLNNSMDRALLIEVLRKGQGVAGSSDTVLGLLSDTTEQGRKFLDETKGRQEKPYIILIESCLKASYFVDRDELDRVQGLLEAFWPGPLTVIFKAKQGLPSYLTGSDGRVALRVPKHPGLLALLKHFKGLFSTSANLTGKPVPVSVDEIDPKILASVSYVALDDQPQMQKPPSTIIDCSGTEIKLVREGAILWSEIEKYLEK